MKKYLLLFSIFLFLLSCAGPYKVPSARNKSAAKRSAPSGKYRNPTIFSRANPFQGRAKAKLAKSKRKKLRLFKKKKNQSKYQRKGRKPGSSFNMKRKVSRGRVRSSGSRVKGTSGRKSGGKRKDLFNTRKK